MKQNEVAQASVSFLGFHQSNLMVVRGVLKVKLGALLKCQGPMDISRIIINLPS